MGYDPQLFWPAGASDPGFGALKLTPLLIQVRTAAEMMAGQNGRLCRFSKES
jgi:hypothetical protein